METTGYKLFRQRKDGTIGPLFINRKQVIPEGQWMESEDHPTKGFAHRPGWHAMMAPVAPHLSEKGRVWRRVRVKDYIVHERPESQGGKWFLARYLLVEPI